MIRPRFSNYLYKTSWNDLNPSLIMWIPELLMLISSEDNSALLAPIQDHEIKEVVFQMDKYKASGYP